MTNLRAPPPASCKKRFSRWRELGLAQIRRRWWEDSACSTMCWRECCSDCWDNPSYIAACLGSPTRFLPAGRCKYWSWAWIISKRFWIFQSTLRATPQVLSVWTCKLKLDEEKSIRGRLAQQNGFGPEFLYNLLRLVKCTAKHKTCRRRAY
jgi:hypothetical protein